MRVAATVAGVCLIRDAVDIVSLLCGHYLRIGFSHIAFIDDASTDGTFELLTEMARHEPRVSVRRIVTDAFTQAAHISDETNALIARGFEIVIPFDADEFWVVDAPALEAKYQGASEVIFCGTWTNFVQNRSATYPRPFGLFGIRYRAPSLPDADRIRVTGFKRSLVCMGAVRKCGIKSRQKVRFGTGQHEAFIENDDIEETSFKNIEETVFDVFHVPLRYKSELTKRGLNYEPRRAPVRKGPAKGWQGPFHRDVVLANRTDEVWAANSAGGDGFLDVYGKPIRLIPDRRLQKLLLLSFLYLSARSVERLLKTVARQTRRSSRRHIQRMLRSAGLMKSKRRTRAR